MAKHLHLVYAPDPIFREKAEAVSEVNAEIRDLVEAMQNTMKIEHAIGLGANMVGVLKRIAVVDLNEPDQPSYVFINPEITWRSDEMQEFVEASVCFPGIDAKIKRSKVIKLSYLDIDGKQQELEAEGFLATVIQHEVDYLDGKIFLDYLSKMKRDMLLKKMEKLMKQHPPHVHGPGCSHH